MTREEEDNRSRFFNKRPCAFPHGAQEVSHRRPVIGGKLHHERCRVSGKHSGLLQHNAGEDDRRNADEIGAGRHPPRAVKQSGGDQGNDRELGSAGNKGRGHDGHTAVTFIFNGTRRHDSGHAAAGADEHGDEGLA